MENIIKAQDIIKEMIEELEYHNKKLAKAREDIQLCLDNDKVGSSLYRNAISNVTTAKDAISKISKEVSEFKKQN